MLIDLESDAERFVWLTRSDMLLERVKVGDGDREAGVPLFESDPLATLTETVLECSQAVRLADDENDDVSSSVRLILFVLALERLFSPAPLWNESENVLVFVFVGDKESVCDRDRRGSVNVIVGETLEAVCS